MKRVLFCCLLSILLVHVMFATRLHSFLVNVNVPKIIKIELGLTKLLQK